jgi:hypothetical protein
MARSRIPTAEQTQVTLGDDRFQQAAADQDSTDELLDTGTAAFAEQMDTPVGRADDGDTRAALLDAPFGATVIVAGRGYTVGRQHTEAIRQVLSAPLVRFLEADAPFAVLDDAVVKRSTVNDDGTIPDDARISLAAVQVQDDVASGLTDRLDGTPAAVTTETDCPDCGPAATTTFQEDDVEVGYRNHAKSIPTNPVGEVRYCLECESTFTRVREVAPDTATIERTRGLYGITDEPVDVGGLYTQSETCQFPMMRERDAYKGLWTASEVAAFVNQKLDDSGEDGELFGFVSVRDGGEKVVWHDDQPWNMEVKFRRVDANVIAERGNREAAPDNTTRSFDVLEGDTPAIEIIRPDPV